MTKKDFVTKYLPFAKECERDTGIPAAFILAQAAIESAWGDVAPRNMFFGIKANGGLKSGWTGDTQLLLTTEYLSHPNGKFPKVKSITQVGKKLWKYRVWDYFRAYKTPAESFKDHAKFFLENKRYAKALAVKDDAKAFATEVAAAGYATDPNYKVLLLTVLTLVEREIPK